MTVVSSAADAKAMTSIGNKPIVALSSVHINFPEENTGLETEHKNVGR